MFPGRIGADSVALLRMIRANESTDWWTSLFYWFLKITSLHGNQIWISSLTQLILLFYSGKVLIDRLPISKRHKDMAVICFSCNPMYGVFGMTIAHDATQTAGILLLIALGIGLQRKEINFETKKWLLLLAFLMLLTTHTGVVFLIFFLISTFFISRRDVRLVFVLGALCVLVSLLSSLGVNRYLNVYGRDIPTKDIPYSLLIADIKCVTQIEGVSLSKKSMVTLNKIAPEENWKKATSCANKDFQINNLEMNDISLSSLRRELILVYVEVLGKYPQVVFMAHIQRSRGVLPPPFFQPPDNQISWQVADPIGKNSGVALQQGPEVLHPSIDGDEFKVSNKVIKLLETLTQSLILLINQASWMWGWAGLWLYPVLLFVFIRRKALGNWWQIALSFSPLMVLHLFCFLLVPYSQPRYYMATILLGQISLAILIISRINNRGLN